jgi:hypothetical protein
MAFTVCYFPLRYSVTYNNGPVLGRGTLRNLTLTGWRLAGDLPMRQGELLSLTFTRPNGQRITLPEAVVRWSRGPESATGTGLMESHT